MGDMQGNSVWSGDIRFIIRQWQLSQKETTILVFIFWNLPSHLVLDNNNIPIMIQVEIHQQVLLRRTPSSQELQIAMVWPQYTFSSCKSSCGPLRPYWLSRTFQELSLLNRERASDAIASPSGLAPRGPSTFEKTLPFLKLITLLFKRREEADIKAAPTRSCFWEIFDTVGWFRCLWRAFSRPLGSPP